MTEIKAAQYTIAAVATAPGRGGVGIVRISGELTCEIAISILGKCPRPRRAEFLSFNHLDGQVIDTGIAVFFPAPHSFTGEDVLELQGHGGPVVLGMLLDRVVQLGARLAEPGEFSKRAYLNNKIDLTQAEAIADLIDSASQQAARLAMRSLQGEFSDFVNDLVEQLIQLRMFVESAIDFPEEEVDFLDDESLRGKLQQILDRLRMSLQSAHQGILLREGLHVVIAGRPNSGKSTLLNKLSGRESAIVDERAGTTRDILREQLHLDGLPLHIIDTAGLRESSHTVEQEGIRRTWKEIEQADLILYLVDDKIGITTEDEASLKQMEAVCPSVTLIHNKVDLTGKAVNRQQNNTKSEIAISAKSGWGIEGLRDLMKEVAGYQSSTEGGFMARRRHIEALKQALQFVEAGERQFRENKAGELLAEELRSAQYALGEITGEVSADELLGRIFSSFCIGK